MMKPIWKCSSSKSSVRKSRNSNTNLFFAVNGVDALAIMAVFRGEYHLYRAIDAAFAIRARINSLTDVKEQKGYAPAVSIGINNGEMISGNIGSTTLRRLDYTVIGDVVNTAQRLQSVAAPGQIIISETAYHIIKESFNCVKLKEVTLKNKGILLLFIM